MTNKSENNFISTIFFYTLVFIPLIPVNRIYEETKLTKKHDNLS